MNRPLNFLHLTTFYPPYSFGGDAMYIYRLSHALGDEGHQVDVIHCIDSYHLLHPAKPEISFKEHPNVKRHGLQSKFGWLSPLLTQQTGQPYLKLNEIHKILESKPYDVIHYHNISLLGPEIMTVQPSKGHSIKLYTTHEHWLVCPMHVLWKFNRRVCEKPGCLWCMLIGKRPPQLWRYNNMIAHTSRYIDQFLSPSRFTAQMHALRGFQPIVAHLPYFIERADNDWKNPTTFPHDKPYFLMVGRLEVIKGFQTVISEWDNVKDYDLLIAGNGKFENQLRLQAASNPRIKFLGVLSQKELGSFYYHAIATIVPSITYETFGIIIVESFARKTPVIVRDLGALPEIVHDSGGGYIFKNNQELQEAINCLGTSRQRRAELGEKGYHAFERLWSKEAHLKLYFDFLRKTALLKFGHIPWEL
jgi:glycosyltransferase involved in cell wall biosynthesis